MNNKNNICRELFNNFLGNSNNWYKILIISFLVLNPIMYFIAKYLFDGNFFVLGWFIVIEAIVIIMMTKECFPFPPLSLLVCECTVLHLIDPHGVYIEIVDNLPVILLVIFSTAAIFFHKNFLSYIFSKLILKIKSKVVLAISILILSALMSAFLDALTVVVIMVSVATGLFSTYNDYIKKYEQEKDNSFNTKRLRIFLRDLLMTSAIGTAIGGVTTLIGEPQNFIIGKIMGWNFITFAHKMLAISSSCFITSIIVCIVIQKFKLFDYGFELTADIFKIIRRGADEIEHNMKLFEKISFFMQGLSLVLFITLIATGFAEIGVIAIAIIGIITAFTGIIEEKRIGEAFEESVPFSVLIILFFAIVSMINSLELFKPIISWAFTFNDRIQLIVFYGINSLLSMISDNVFVATIYINEVRKAFESGLISREQFEKLAIAINAGTNISSIATPNGQAALLFLLTSAISPLINLSYGRMMKMALPYFVVLSGVMLLVIYFI